MEEEEEGGGEEGERESADGEESLLAQRILDALQPGEELASLFREPYASTTDRICELNRSHHELACVAGTGGICEHNRSVEVQFVGDALADICEHNRSALICEHNRSLEVGQRVRVVGLLEDTQVLSSLALLVQKYKY